jgi:DNA polymerase III sliding clamp (beta) subunit (PCNA family)
MHVPKGALCAALKKLVRLIPRQSQSPFDRISLSANAGRLQLTASDGISWLRVWLACEGNNFRASLPGRALLEFVSGADRDDIIEFAAEEKRVDVAFELCLSSFESIADLPPTPGDERAMEWNVEAEWDEGELRAALTWVLPAVSRDATRPNLIVVMFDEDRVVASDGHRLHMTSLVGLRSAPVTLPGSAAAVLAETSGNDPIALERSGKHLRFRGDDWQLITREADTQFPPYKRTIPSREAATCEVQIDAAVAVAALRTLSRPSSSCSQGVQMRVNGQLVLERHDDAARVGRATVPLMRSTHRGDDLVVGICARYLAEALAGGGVQCLRFGGPLEPVVVDHDDGCIAVVMPMRL